MGGQRCVAFGCKSGCKRGAANKKEKVHFFQVPKDGEKLWQRALLRKDIVIKAGQGVCHKHFLKEEILWRKELRAPDGRILGVSADYKKPRLQKGSLPSLFLGLTPEIKIEEPSASGVEESLESSDPMDTCDKNDNCSVEPKNNLHREVPVCTVLKEFLLKTGLRETYYKNNINSQPETENSKQIVRNNFQHTESYVENHSPGCILKVTEKLVDETSLFEVIINNERSVTLPLGWSRQKMKYAGKRLVHFCIFVPRMENEMIQPICIKQVLVDENLDTNILVMRQKINKEKTDLRKEPLSSIQDLEHLLKGVNGWKVCLGLRMSNEDNIQESYIHRDKEGVLRHVDCTLYIPGASRSVCCDECKRSKKVLTRKMVRMSAIGDLQRLRVSLNAQQRRRLDEMKREMKSIRRARDRAFARILILKELRVRDLQEKKASQKTLEQMIQESSLTGNERLVMLEILSAGKQKDSRSRRYSRPWIILCLALHKRSPVTYRFLRANNILPLPAPRTILRFAALNRPVTEDTPSTNVADETICANDSVFEIEEILSQDEVPNVEMETEVS